MDKNEINNLVLIIIFEACCDAYFASIAARYIVELAPTFYLTDTKSNNQLLALVSFVFRDKILKHIHTLKC